MESIDRRFAPILIVILTTVIAGGIADLGLDKPPRWDNPHAVYEVFLLVVIAGAVIYLWLGWRSASATLQVTRRNLRERQEERDAWRRNARSLLEGLGEAIDEQFSEWDLTPSEREVALLLLKGHSHMEAAKMTDRSERTVRQHAVSVYRKSGLSGRAELAGFFLGDLILPADAAVDRDEKVSPGS